MRSFQRLSLVLLLLVVGCISQSGPDQTLTAKLDPILHQLDDGGAVVSARVIDLSTHRELYASNPDDRFIPASNMKLQTGSAGLDRLGANHVFKTYLAFDGDDLWLIGTGDPACGDAKVEAQYGRTTTSMLDDFVHSLKARGVTKIKGTFYFYDGAFDGELVEHTWSKDFLTDWYAAPVSGLNFNDNCIDVTVTPTEPDKPVRYEVVPPTSGNKIINEATTARADQRETITLERDRE